MSDRTLRLASYLFAIVGLGCAGYLTYTKLASGGMCLVSGCSVVQTSEWSELLGLPVTAFGVAGYLMVLLLLSLRGETPRLLLVLVTGVGFLFSMYLMYRAYITLKAFCPFCTGSALMMMLLFIVSSARFVRGPDLPAGDDPDDADDEAHLAPAG